MILSKIKTGRQFRCKSFEMRVNKVPAQHRLTSTLILMPRKVFVEVLFYSRGSGKGIKSSARRHFMYIYIFKTHTHGTCIHLIYKSHNMRRTTCAKRGQLTRTRKGRYIIIRI